MFVFLREFSELLLGHRDTCQPYMSENCDMVLD